MSKLGFHINDIRDEGELLEAIRRGNPAVVKVLPDSPEFVRKVLEGTSDTVVILRQYVGSQPLDDPLQNAQEMFHRLMQRSDVQEFGRHERVRVEGYNEVSGDWPTLIRYVDFDVALAGMLHEKGIQFVSGSWSRGYPDLGFWKLGDAVERLRKLQESGAWLGLHEYSSHDAAHLDEKDWGWLMLRYRRIRQILAERGITMPFVITEAGIDNGHGQGWKTITDAHGYLTLLQKYDEELRKDGYVLGAAIYCFQVTDPHWYSFDISRSPLLPGLLDYMRRTDRGATARAGVCRATYVADSLPTGPGQYETRSLDEIDEVVIHHSATKPDVSLRAIARWHTGHHKWPGIGYHFVVYPDGRTFQTNDLATVSYHAGPHNRRSVGICLTGNFMEQEPPDAQIEAARRLIECLNGQVTVKKAIGHREAMPGHTDCPGDTWPEWKERVGPQESGGEGMETAREAIGRVIEKAAKFGWKIQVFEPEGESTDGFAWVPVDVWEDTSFKASPEIHLAPLPDGAETVYSADVVKWWNSAPYEVKCAECKTCFKDGQGVRETVAIPGMTEAFSWGENNYALECADWVPKFYVCDKLHPSAVVCLGMMKPGGHHKLNVTFALRPVKGAGPKPSPTPEPEPKPEPSPAPSPSGGLCGVLYAIGMALVKACGGKHESE